MVGYKRLCLVSEKLEERVTLDTRASFVDPGPAATTLDDVVIIELKQRRINRLSPFYRLLPLGISPSPSNTVPVSPRPRITR